MYGAGGAVISLPDLLALFRVLCVPVIISLVLATERTELEYLFGAAAALVACAAATSTSRRPWWVRR